MPDARACQQLNTHVCLLNMKKRKYTKTRRAEQQEQTRERIVKAAMTLHEKLGPAKTTIKAVAEEAGVQRLTVYRHFPDDSSLFQACTSHWLALHPPPAVTAWATIKEARERSRAALLLFYKYYRRTEKMWRVAYRDVDSVAALQGPMAEFEAYLDSVSHDLVSSWETTQNSKRQLAMTLRHCLRFSTWRSLKNEGLKDEKIIRLVDMWLNGIIS